MRTFTLILTLFALTAFAGAETYPLWSGPEIPSDPAKVPFAEGIEHRTILDAREHDYKFLHGAAISHGDNLLKWDSVLIPFPEELKPHFAETTVWAEGENVLAVIRAGRGQGQEQAMVLSLRLRT